MKGGWITLPRRFFDGAAWRENRKLSRAEAVLDLYQRAQWDAGEVFIRGKLLPIERGEQVASCRFLAERWGWTKDTVARFLKTMESEASANRSNSATPNGLLIRSEVRQGETVLILCNYDEWTLAGIGGCDSGEPGNETQLETGTRTPARQGRDKAKEGKEDKESKNEKGEPAGELFGTDPKIPELPAKADPFTAALAEIWEAAHPRGRARSSKKEVLQELKKLKAADLPAPGVFRTSLELWKATEDWTKDGGEFVPAIHRWIASRKWEVAASDLTAAGGLGRLTDEEYDKLCGARGWMTPEELAEIEARARRNAAMDSIVKAYPRRENQVDCMMLVRAHLETGEDPEVMLSKTLAIAEVIGRSDENFRIAPPADRFFRDQRWRDDPSTFHRGTDGPVRIPVEPVFDH